MNVLVVSEAFLGGVQINLERRLAHDALGLVVHLLSCRCALSRQPLREKGVQRRVGVVGPVRAVQIDCLGREQRTEDIRGVGDPIVPPPAPGSRDPRKDC